MRVAIDISQVIYGTGVSQYTSELVRHLLKFDKENDYLLFGGTLRRKGDILKLFPQAKVFPFPPTLANLVWNRLHILSVEKLIGKVDVLHTSDWTEPPSSAFKVTTVHDLSPLLFPNLFPRDVLRNVVNAHKLKLSLVKKESKRIIVPTNATKEDLIALGFDSSRIRVIPEAVRPIYHRVGNAEIERVKRKHKIFGDYLFAVGMDPRKNTERIIKAFELSRAGKNIKMVFAGQPKYMKVKPSRNVYVLGRVEDRDMPALYSGAKAFVYPSLYEGFGLPILEAFACGVPVVTSNISSMVEIAGEAAVLVDPQDTDSIAEGILKALRGPKSFIEKGRVRVSDFSWKKTAFDTIRVYDEAKK